jgi:hypothetical protein
VQLASGNNDGPWNGSSAASFTMMTSRSRSSRAARQPSETVQAAPLPPACRARALMRYLARRHTGSSPRQSG